MRRTKKFQRFFQQRQYEIASIVLFLSVAIMTGVYISNRITSQNRQSEIAKDRISQEADLAELEDAQPETDAEEQLSSVTSVIQPEKKEPEKIAEEPVKEIQEEKEVDLEQETEQEEVASDNKQMLETQSDAVKELHFSPEKDLSWPLRGDVILNYSMDQTVYFATLDQYKYNPALIIAGEVNTPVNAAATGKITSIETNEETGLTITMDLGDGYSAVYGQLKEVMYKEGAVVEAGNAIGYVAEPTKYYSVEGSNLYFELLKDNTPVNPLQYMD